MVVLSHWLLTSHHQPITLQQIHDGHETPPPVLIGKSTQCRRHRKYRTKIYQNSVSVHCCQNVDIVLLVRLLWPMLELFNTTEICINFFYFGTCALCEVVACEELWCLYIFLFICVWSFVWALCWMWRPKAAFREVFYKCLFVSFLICHKPTVIMWCRSFHTVF